MRMLIIFANRTDKNGKNDNDIFVTSPALPVVCVWRFYYSDNWKPQATQDIYYKRIKTIIFLVKFINIHDHTMTTSVYMIQTSF